MVILLILLLLLFLNHLNYELFINDDNTLEYLYNNYLKKDFYTIFKSRNRNAGGVFFFKYAYDKYINDEFSEEQFNNFHKIYCAVSGSPISPNRKKTSDIVKVKKYKSSEYKIGRYYRCCSPCLCDIMKYTLVYETVIKDINYNLLIIKDPCKNPSKIPKSAPEFKCKDNKLLNSIHLDEITNDINDQEYIVIGLLYSEEGDVNNTLESCKERFKTDNPKWGMGNIFINISKAGLDKEEYLGYISN